MNAEAIDPLRRRPEPAIPATVLEATGKYLNTASRIADWEIGSLTTTNPTVRITIGNDSWILKKSRSVRKELLAGRIFDAFGITSTHPSVVQDDWLLMDDIGRHTLETLPRQDYRANLFAELGKAAADATLMGMRDRKLGNMVVTPIADGAGYALCHIDYEGVFRTGVVNWLLRPDRYHRYLLTRLLFDVVRHFGEAGVANAFSLFLAGFHEELDRISGVRLPPGLSKEMSLTELMIFRGRPKNPEESCKRLRAAFNRLARDHR